MPEPLLPPVNSINWKLIDATESMMDRGFCDKKAPLLWRSSIAIYAFEPDQEELEESLCGDRLTYLKATVSITGYQPDPLSADESLDVFGEIAELTGTEYLGCYGALVNVSVFPPQSFEEDLSLYPRIIDFEPKQRDLMETRTDTGEVLIGSSTSVQVDKSASQTFGRETGASHTGKYTSPESAYGKWEASHTFSGKWTNSTEESYNVNVDGAQDRRERFSHETTISQLYNVLTGYHAGTNRAAFLMLARPHVLQPTDRRTFVRGLRQIEGMQDFFLVVRRPRSISQMRIEVGLDTGHFPERPVISIPQARYEYDRVNLQIRVPVQGSGAVEGRTQIVNEVRRGFEIDGWEFDSTRNRGSWDDEGAGEEVRGAVRLLNWSVSGGMHRSDIKTYDFFVTNPDTFTLTARIERGLNAGNDTWTLNFRIYRRRLIDDSRTPYVATDSMVVTRRKLCTAIEFSEGCALRIPAQTMNSEMMDWIVAEPIIRIPEAAVNSALRGESGAALNHTLMAIRTGLVSSGANPLQYPVGSVQFNQSDYMFRRLALNLPKDKANIPLTQVSDVPKSVLKKLGNKATVGTFVNLDIALLTRRSKISLDEVLTTRKLVLNWLKASKDETDLI
jgi:hypothetical protein